MSANPPVSTTPDKSRTEEGRPDSAGPPTTPPPRPTAAAFGANLARGALIGAAETVPGVSGGTVALVTGVYGRLIGSAKHLVDLPRAVVSGEWRSAVRRIDWWLLVPIGLGMAVMVATIAGVMEEFVTEQPVYSRALFMGMIAMSVVVPFLEISPGALTSRRDKTRAFGVFAVAAIAVFALTSLPRSEIVDPPLLLVFAVAAVAVCALVLPGVSGSFFLLVVGVYAPTMAAVDSVDLAYLATFALGAIVGLASFVRILERLLANHHTTAMVAAGGLLLGSLRALWPWQTDDGGVLGVGADWPGALGLFLIGALLVGVVVVLQRRRFTTDTDGLSPGEMGSRVAAR